MDVRNKERSVGAHLVHGVHGEHDEHVHDVVRVEAAVHRAREPLLRYVHGADHATAQGYCILEHLDGHLLVRSYTAVTWWTSHPYAQNVLGIPSLCV